MTYDTSDFDDNRVGCYKDQGTAPKRIFSYLESINVGTMLDCETACEASDFGYFGNALQILKGLNEEVFRK